MPPTIDVLIVTTRARDLVVSCLEHLSRQTVEHRVFVADNAGDEDGTSTVLRERFPDVELVTNTENLGFGKALRVLVGRGSGDVIVLVNDDMDVEATFLEALVAPLSDPDVAMVAGLTLQPGGTELVDGFGIEVDPTLQAYNRLRHRRTSDQPGVLLGPSGGAAAYRRSAWEQVGGLDPAFFVYAEDLDLALRLREAGYRAAEAPDARGVHLGGATTGRDSDFTTTHSGFGRAFVLRRYGVLQTRHAPRAVLVETLTVLYGLLVRRTTIPITSRIAGWRAAGRVARHRYPREGVDRSITLREQLRRSRHER
jgi:N-acetylglucosaminyl-diphospho-decaprenol L-rhamnosyltransferase